MRRQPEYVCDGCAACCTSLIVPVYNDDRNREPLVRAASDRLPLATITFQDGASYQYHVLNYHDGEGCPLLNEHGACTVYATRPHCCEKFEPGGAMCMWARGKAGITRPLAEVVNA